jgi:hypothetical protein
MKAMGDVRTRAETRVETQFDRGEGKAALLGSVRLGEGDLT